MAADQNRPIMNAAKLLVMGFVCVGLWGCSESNEARSSKEVDELVDETWIDLNEWKPIPVKQWLSSSGSNRIDFLTREEALSIADRSLKEHGVELLAVVGDDLPHWAQFVIGKVKGLKDKSAYTQALLNASANRKLEVEYGTKWVVMTELSDDDSVEK